MTTSAPNRPAPAEHLSGLERAVRRANGQVYTEPTLAEFVIDRALEDNDLPCGPMLDPACGGGVFLSALIRRIAQSHISEGRDITAGDRRRFLRDVKKSVFGVDTDGAAVEITRDSLHAEMEYLTRDRLKGGFFTQNVVQADFLFDDLEGLLSKRPMLIVGNPPYVPIDRLESTYKDRIRARFRTATGRLDLYTVFMERASSLLDENGRWAFITPDKFLQTQSSKKLREFLGDAGSIRSVTLFSSHRVFVEAATVPCVTVWERRRGEQTVRLAHAAISAEDRTIVDSSASVTSKQFSGPTWHISRDRGSTLRARLMANHRQLRDVTARISAGPATGLNPAFVVEKAVADELEPALLHPTVRGRDIHRNKIDDTGQRMLIPYAPDRNGIPRLVEIEEYPAAKRWLGQYMDQLTRRHCVRKWGKAWFDLHDPIGRDLSLASKVLFPDVAKSNRFALDLDGRYIPQHTAYYMIPADIHPPLLTAILNSSYVEFLVRSHAPLVKDGFSRYRRQFLLDLPIPVLGAGDTAEILEAASEDRRDDVDKILATVLNADVAEIADALALLDSTAR